MVESTKNLIQKSSNDKAVLMKNQSELWKELHSYLGDNTSSMIDQTDSTKVYLDCTRKVFENGWVHHKEMNNILVNQQGILVKRGSEHSSKINLQLY